MITIARRDYTITPKGDKSFDGYSAVSKRLASHSIRATSTDCFGRVTENRVGMGRQFVERRRVQVTLNPLRNSIRYFDCR